MSCSFRALSSRRAVRTLAVMSVSFSTVRPQAVNCSRRVYSRLCYADPQRKAGHPVAAPGNLGEKVSMDS